MSDRAWQESPIYSCVVQLVERLTVNQDALWESRVRVTPQEPYASLVELGRHAKLKTWSEKVRVQVSQEAPTAEVKFKVNHIRLCRVQRITLP